MLPWKPAASPEAVLAIQLAIYLHPDGLDCEQLYYYVTDRDCAAALNIADLSEVPITTVNTLFEGLDRQSVFAFQLKTKRMWGYFASEKTLCDGGIVPPRWADSECTAQRPTGRRVRRPRGAKL
jgi:hypothetical protein